MRDDDTNNLMLPHLLRKADKERAMGKPSVWERIWGFFVGYPPPRDIYQAQSPRVISYCSVCEIGYATRPIGSFVPEDGKCYFHSTGRERGSERKRTVATVSDIQSARGRKQR